ncbi:HD domain-containing protein [Alteribacillus persepolensis]|uniref:HD domain-containing protein n=1 Tax=Alteribacillus persepolensis TaxID=568899 RepID=A0A1G8F8B4_9BACI|nr:HD domain-containing protein [Alteribacillus persepolensis]SDH78315.1 HD domain-containing protein [Alteribacillus persepolensis]
MDLLQVDTINAAIHLAAKAHRSQVRKGNQLPYITHSYAVGLLLSQSGCSKDVIAAGILHDTIEDTPITKSDLRTEFGKHVTAIVDGCTEDKSLTWEERKQHTLDFLRTASLEVCMVICADKLHNIRETVRDFEQVGEEIWNQFNRGKGKQKWYYENLVDVLGERLETFPLYPLLAEEVDKLFHTS